jgi:pseudaminic acid cytidylyltransferase
MRVIAIIPARKGSKRIPNKNIKDFKNKPMISYAITAALSCGEFDEIYVSTDSQEIADIAVKFGAKVPWLRSAELSDDYATTMEVMSDAVRKIVDSTETNCEVSCIYPCVPLLDPLHISNALSTLREGKWEFVTTVTRVKYPIHRLLTADQNSVLQMMQPSNAGVRTQDLPITYLDAGQFYWGTKESWLNRKSIFSGTGTFFELPENSIIDIDTVEDWEMAEKIYDQRNS